MIDFSITEVMDEAACMAWLERHLYPEGVGCPHCGRANRRLFRQQKPFPAYRWRDCDGSSTLLTHTAFAQTRQSPATRVVVLRGSSKGESTARLARELKMSRQNLGSLRKRVLQKLDDTVPIAMMEGREFAADEVDLNAEEKKEAPCRPLRPTTPARQQSQRHGHV